MIGLITRARELANRLASLPSSEHAEEIRAVFEALDVDAYVRGYIAPRTEAPAIVDRLTASRWLVRDARAAYRLELLRDARRTVAVCDYLESSLVLGDRATRDHVQAVGLAIVTRKAAA